MFYVGLDIHAKQIAICVLNETGQFVHRSQVRTIDQMMGILEGLPDRFEVCYQERSQGCRTIGEAVISWGGADRACALA